MSEPTKPADTRSVLNAVASVRAGQEQMQQDIDKVRAGINAMVVFSAYAIAIGVIAYLTIRKGIAQ